MNHQSDHFVEAVKVGRGVFVLSHYITNIVVTYMFWLNEFRNMLILFYLFLSILKKIAKFFI